jgi:hypothetical protein
MTSPLFRVSQIPDQAVTRTNHHLGVDGLFDVMGRNGLEFFRTSSSGTENGTNGFIAADDVVLVKVNASGSTGAAPTAIWSGRVIQRILEHPDGFSAEVMIVENGQGRGSLACDTSLNYGNSEVHANAEDDQHSFLWLVNSLFRDTRVSAYLFGTIYENFIYDSDHQAAGYRHLDNVSCPCFTTAGGRRVELAQRIWNGSSFEHNLKLSNIPVLKPHDVGGSEIMGALKHMYGLVSMSNGQANFRHYDGLGETCGKMMVTVHTPVLNIVDAVWISQAAVAGYPEAATTRSTRSSPAKTPWPPITGRPSTSSIPSMPTSTTGLTIPGSTPG